MVAFVLVLSLCQEPDQTRAEKLVAEVVVEVNSVRRAAGLKELQIHLQLATSSMALAKDLAYRGILEHRDHRGWGMKERIEEVGYRDWLRLGENIACGQRSSKEVVNAWLKSPSHRKMMLEPSFTETGVAIASTKEGMFYWVQQFGCR